jgi:CRP/FNR family transcriptional regulator, cyclic AMP receptor protein
MTANSAFAVRHGRSSDGPASELPKRLWRNQQDRREGGEEICASSKQGVGLRPLIQAVNTLRRSPLFAQLSDEDIARLNARCLWRRIRTGEFLLDEPTDGCALSIVTNGRFRAVQMMNGREIILRDIEEGEYFGELSAIDGRAGPAQIIASTDAIVARMPSQIFRETVRQFPSFCDQLLVSLAEQIRSMNDRFSEQISLTARERLCVELLRLSRRTAKDRIAVSPPPSHAELASRIGGLRETVTKLLIALERDGLISRSRSAIALIDVPRLRMIAAARKGAA